VSGNIYVFASPDSGVSQVRFYLDNTSASGTPVQTENTAPWDYAGGSITAANAYDTAKLSNGSHSITAAITLTSGATTVTTATFNVNNTTSPTATPVAPTPTGIAPTATAPAPVASGSIYWGVNMQGVPWDLTKLSNWERDVAGKAVSIVHWGHTWENNGSYRNWSSSPANNARSHGSIPMISWTPEGADNTRYQLGDIIRGDHDAYIRRFATDAKAWGQPFFLRIMHEMNGAWGYPWQEDVNGNKRGEFVQAWRHIIDVFRAVGTTNASYVWCPNIEFPNSPNPTYASLYPGDSYVDWSCLDGYNWGTARSTGWQTFDQVFSYSYNEVLKVAPSKPMMLGEFGSVEQGGSKANWFTDTLKTQLPGKYNRIRAAV
jgi:beta-mannanase